MRFRRRGYDPEHPAVQALRDTPAPELAARRAELQAAANAAGLGPDEIGEVLNSRPELPRPLLPTRSRSARFRRSTGY